MFSFKTSGGGWRVGREHRTKGEHVEGFASLWGSSFKDGTTAGLEALKERGSLASKEHPRKGKGV